MKGDFTRSTFLKEKHYSSVRLQQGRVQLDAEWNEQMDILAHLNETTRYDVIGPCGAPMEDAGFELQVQSGDIHIGAGRYYVNGILCENDQTGGVLFTQQMDLPGETLPTDSGLYFGYLDVHARHITALEDQDIREVALGGPDTTTRTKTVWQVKLLKVGELGDSVNCLSQPSAWGDEIAPSTGKLRARAEPGALTSEPCILPPGAGYRRLENQLYRVEIHKGSDASGGPTFKWSRDNAHLVSRLEAIDGTANTLTVSQTGKDELTRFAPGQWVELNDEEGVLRGDHGVLVELAAVDGNELTVTSWPGGSAPTLGSKPTVRRWDSAGEVTLATGSYLPLEDGVQVEFAAGDYHTGDYWLIPARTVLGDVLWQTDESTGDALFEAPLGILHRYCVLAVLSFDGTTWSVLSDCRNLFPTLTEMTHLFYVSGDGQEAMPGDALPQPLQVGVSNGEHPVASAGIKFKVLIGSGQLQEGSNSGTEITVLTNADGIAECAWTLGNTHLSQRVEAVLLDAAADPVHLPVRFNANLSVAGQVFYDSEGCPLNPNAPVTVQDALDQLCANFALYYVSGDGQEAMPKQKLPQSLQVRVANGVWPVSQAQVKFKVAVGNGKIEAGSNSGTELIVPTDAQGLAECGWTLDAKNASQQVEAVLLDSAGDPVNLPVRFNANLSMASQVAYDPSKCPPLKEAKANTVQKAIDALCKQGRREAQPGIHILDVTLANGDRLRNDRAVTANALAEGLHVICDAAVDSASVVKKPTVIVSLDLPYPLTSTDMALWGTGPAIAFQPIKLAAIASGSDERIIWAPTQDTKDWLVNRLFQVIKELERGERLLAHLTLKGNFIWGPERGLYLDGDAYGVRARGGRTDVNLPSGDGHKGGDFEMWFWLVAG